MNLGRWWTHAAKDGRMWSSGRWWLNDRKGGGGWNGIEASAQWVFGRFWQLACQINLGPGNLSDGNANSVTVHFAIPLFCVFLTVSGIFPRWSLPGDRIIPGSAKPAPWRGDGSVYYDRTPGRSIGFTCHDEAVWVSVWERDDGSWQSSDPWHWKVHRISPMGLLVGEQRTKRVSVESLGDVPIPMPEGVYTARAERVRYETRRRWPWPVHRWQRICLEDIKAADGTESIPFPGKGENSWDCGMDGLFSISHAQDVDTLEEAIGETVADVMRTRLKRTGSAFWVPEPAHA